MPSHIQSGALELSEWPCASCALSIRHGNFYLCWATLCEGATLGVSVPNDEGYYYIVLRKDNTLGAKNLSATLVRDIELVVQGIPIVAACVSYAYPI